MGLVWWSSGTLTSALGSTLMNDIIERGEAYEKYIPYCRRLQTICTLSVIILSPIGMFLAHFFGQKLLKIDSPKLYKLRRMSAKRKI